MTEVVQCPPSMWSCPGTRGEGMRDPVLSHNLGHVWSTWGEWMVVLQSRKTM